MNTELDERIRAAFDDIFEATPELGPAPSRLQPSDTVAGSKHKPWLLIAAAAIVMIGIGGLLRIAQQRGENELTTSNVPTVQPDRPIGQFVWPAPPRDLASLDALIDGFTGEVLSWAPLDVRREGDTTTESAPQALTLVNTRLNAEVTLVATPSPDGWGFIQIGDSLEALLADEATISVRFQRPPGTSSSSVDARFSDGTVVADTTTGGSFELPEGRQLDSLNSVLVVHVDQNGDVIGVSGGQFASGEVQPPSSAQEEPRPTVAVPDLIGLPQDDAAQELLERGLSYQIVVDDQIDSGLDGTVLTMAPSAGSELEMGSLVTLTVRSG